MSYCKTFPDELSLCVPLDRVLNHFKSFKGGEVKAVSESALKESPMVPVGLAACAVPPNYD